MSSDEILRNFNDLASRFKAQTYLAKINLQIIKKQCKCQDMKLHIY